MPGASCSLLFAAFCLLPAAKQKMHPIARFPAALATLQTLRLPKGPSFQARPQQWGSCNYTIDKLGCCAARIALVGMTHTSHFMSHISCHRCVSRAVRCPEQCHKLVGWARRRRQNWVPTRGPLQQREMENKSKSWFHLIAGHHQRFHNLAV